MPAIKKDDKQLTALQEIETALATVRQMNTAMEQGVPLQVIATPDKGKAIKIDIPADESKAIVGTIGRVRTKLVKEVRSKAAKFKIDLDESDNAVLDAF